MFTIPSLLPVLLHSSSYSSLTPPPLSFSSRGTRRSANRLRPSGWVFDEFSATFIAYDTLIDSQLTATSCTQRPHPPIAGFLARHPLVDRRPVFTNCRSLEWRLGGRLFTLPNAKQLLFYCGLCPHPPRGPGMMILRRETRDRGRRKAESLCGD